jgi:hypothetical protein
VSRLHLALSTCASPRLLVFSAWPGKLPSRQNLFTSVGIMSALSEWGGVLSSIVTIGGKNDRWMIKCLICDVVLESKSTWMQHTDSTTHTPAPRGRNLDPTGANWQPGAGVSAAPKDDDPKDAKLSKSTGVTPTAPAHAHHDDDYRRDEKAGVPVPRSKQRSPTTVETAPGEFDIAKALTSQLAKKHPIAPAEGHEAGKKVVAPAPKSSAKEAPKAPMPAPKKSFADDRKDAKESFTKTGVKAKEPEPAPVIKSVPPKPQAAHTTLAGMLRQSSGAPADHDPRRKSPEPAPAAGAKAEPPMLFTVSGVNAGKAKGVEVAPMPVGAPLIDPKLDRTKTRSLGWLARTPIVSTEQVSENPPTFKATFRLPASLHRLHTVDAEPASKLNRSPAPSSALNRGAGSTTPPLQTSDSSTTAGRLRAAFDLIAKEVKLEEDRDGSEVKLTTAEAIPLATLRMLESFFTASVCFAPYDEPITAGVTGVSARVDTARFWS